MSNQTREAVEYLVKPRTLFALIIKKLRVNPPLTYLCGRRSKRVGNNIRLGKRCIRGNVFFIGGLEEK